MDEICVKIKYNNDSIVHPSSNSARVRESFAADEIMNENFACLRRVVPYRRKLKKRAKREKSTRHDHTLYLITCLYIVWWSDVWEIILYISLQMFSFLLLQGKVWTVSNKFFCSCNIVSLTVFTIIIWW